MKKSFLLLAAFAVCFAACENKDNGGGKEHEEPVNDSELKLTVDVKLQHEVTTNFEGTVASIDGQKILDFFDMTAEEYYVAMGSVNVTDAPSGQTSQENNTLEYGAYYAPEELYSFTPQTSNNLGHWFSKDGHMSWWSCEDYPHYFFTENRCEWGLEDTASAENFSYDDMWKYTVGIDPGVYDLNEGDTLSATEIIYETATMKTVYITWNISIVGFVDPEADKYDPANRQNTETTVEATIPQEGAQLKTLDKIQDAFQLTKAQLNTAIVAGQVTTENFINNESVEPSAGGFGGVWFDAEGNRTTWGEETGATYFVELISTPLDLYVNVGFYGETSYAAVQGKTIDNFKQVVTYTPEEGTSYTCTITYKLTF